MHVEYHITEQDFVWAQRLAFKRATQPVLRWMFSVIPAFGTALLLLMIFLIVTRGLAGNIPGLAVALMLVLLPLIILWNIRRLYKTFRNLQGTFSLDADDSGLSFQGSTASSRATWAHYSRFLEDDHSFLLFQNNKLFNVLPKREMTAEQIAALHELFTTHIRSRSKERQASSA